ncbi:MAG: nitroreductase/quinone reductase family protein [Candidatus Binatia bacterium]
MSSLSTVARQDVQPLSKRRQWLYKHIIKAISVVNIWVFRVSRGRIGGHIPSEAPILLLTTKGRKSGQPRTAPLLYIEHDGALVVVASYAGLSHYPLWYWNLVTNPEAAVELAGEKRRVKARRATAAEEAVLWPKLVAACQRYTIYRRRTEREFPVMILTADLPREMGSSY